MFLFVSLCLIVFLFDATSAALGVADDVTAPPSSTFDVVEALRYLWLSWSTTCSDESIMSWKCSWCQLAGSTVVPIGTASDNATLGETKGLVAVSNGTVYVAFRGSSNLANWVFDFTFLKREYPGGPPGTEVHRGFYECWQGLTHHIRRLVEKALASKHCAGPGQCTRLLITGHSLGAAQALLQALDFRQKPPRSPTPRHFTVELVNFGEPRVGNGEFARYANAPGVLQRLQRVTHLRDPVPHVPFVEFGFEHAPQEVYNYVPDGQNVRVCSPTDGEDPFCSNSVYDWDPLAHDLYLGYDLHGKFGCE